MCLKIIIIFIECKKTDTVTNRVKDSEWEKMTDKFNAVVGSGRTTRQLRMKWDSWKKTIRKSYSLKKSSLHKTGGGPSGGNLSNWEEKILSIIGISATGIDCPFDSDNNGEGSSI